MYCGIDLGSRTVKIALLKNKGLFEFRKFVAADFYRQYGQLTNGALIIDLDVLGIPKIFAPVITGCGRQSVQITGARSIPEVKAHVLGAVFKTGLLDFTLLDIGSVVLKVALVRGGRMVDSQTNDKTAAGTGRYLENMAGDLGLDLAELGNHYHNPVKFCKTSSLPGEHSIPSLAAGVNFTAFKRIRPVLLKLKSDTLVFTGGAAYNKALVTIMEKKLGLDVVVPRNPEYAGAIGCCLASRVEVEKENIPRGLRSV